MSTILGLIGLSPATLLAIGGAVIAALGWLWKTKRDSKAAGVAEERAKTDAANAEFVQEHRNEKNAVDRLSPSAVDSELQRWSPKR